MIHRYSCCCKYYFSKVNWILAILLWLIVSPAIAEKLSYSFKKKTLSEVLDKISSNNHVKIAFDTQLADKQLVNGAFKGESVDELLQQVLASSRFEMERIGTVYVVKPKREVTLAVKHAPVVVSPTFELPRYKIWGTIVDQETGEKLPYAYVYTVDKKYAVTANAEGYFNLMLPSSTPVTLCISYLGFEMKCVEVFPESKSRMLSINLDRAHAVINSVVITQKQNYLVQIPSVAGKSTINPRAASDVPAINSLDFTPLLQMLPGVDATTESAANLSIRKSPSSQTQVLFDGYTLYHINHFLGQLSAFNSKAIKDIQIFKGGFDVRYGGAASAVIEITGKSGNRYKPSFSVGADLLSADAFADVPLGKKINLVVAARRSYTDIYQTPLYNKLFDKLRSDIAETSIRDISSYNVKYSPKYHFYDLHSKLSYNPDSTQSLSLSVYGGNDKMDLNDTDTRLNLSEMSDISNMGIGFKWSKQAGAKYFLRTSLGYSSYLLNFTHLNVLRNTNLDEVARRYGALYNHLNDFTGKVECEYRFLPQAGIIVGGTFNSLNCGNSFKNYRTNSTNVLIDTVRRTGAEGCIATGYVLLDAGKGWLKGFTPGMRLTYFSPTKKVYVEPRAQLSVEVAKGVILKMAAGRYLQFINSVPVPFIGNYTSYWVVANGDNLPVLSSNHYIVGLTYDATSRLQFDVESYFKKANGLVSQGQVPTLVARKYRLLQKDFYSSSDILGIDLLAKYLYPRGQLALAYSLSKATVFSESKGVDNQFPAANDQRHELKTFVSYKIGRVNLSAAWIFGSGKPWDELVLYNNFRPTPDYQRNSRNLDKYHCLDLAASYEQKIGSALLSVTASVFNAYDRANEIRRTYSFSSTPLQDISKGKNPVSYTDIYGLGITPSIYVSLAF